MTVKRTLFATLLFISLMPIYALAASLPQDQTKAVILAYHRIGEDSFPDSNLRIEQFEEHLDEITRGGYNVITLPALLTAIKSDQKLPPKTITITFEGAYKSAYKNAMQHLLEKQLPFTVIYAANNADQTRPGYIGWQELKTLAKNKNVTLATLPASHSHIAHTSENDILINLNKARQRHREEFGVETQILSYPFGEYSTTLETLAKQQGFTAALGLHSGAAYADTDTFTLPRFSMTENYGDLERFRMVTNALPLPVIDIEPQNPDITDKDFALGFTLPESLKGKNLSCFLSGQPRPSVERLENRVEIRATESTAHQARLRLNCTMPETNSENDQTQWRWFGMLFHRKISDQ